MNPQHFKNVLFLTLITHTDDIYYFFSVHIIEFNIASETNVTFQLTWSLYLGLYLLVLV